MKIIFKEEALYDLYETGKDNDKKYMKNCKNKRLVDGYVRAVDKKYAWYSSRNIIGSFLRYL